MKRRRSSLRNSSTKLSRTITVPSVRHSPFSKCSRWLLLIASKPTASLFTRQNRRKSVAAEPFSSTSRTVVPNYEIAPQCSRTLLLELTQFWLDAEIPLFIRSLDTDVYYGEAVSREGELFPAMEPRPVASTIFLCSRRRVDRSVSPTLQEKFLACLPTL